MKLIFVLVFAALSTTAQTNSGTFTNDPPPASAPDLPAEISQIQTNRDLPLAQRVERIRTACIEGRRSIAGRILKVLPDGLVIDSGFTNLLRAPLNRSWLVPGIVSASRPAHSVERSEPGSLCVGLVFLTNLPKSRGTRPKLYDYVMIEGYPAGESTYTSVGTVQRTIRKFSANLDATINWQLKTSQNSSAYRPPVFVPPKAIGPFGPLSKTPVPGTMLASCVLINSWQPIFEYEKKGLFARGELYVVGQRTRL